MCIPIRVLRIYAKITNYITMALGIAISIVAGYAYYQILVYPSEIASYTSILIYVAWGIGGFIFLIGLAGLIGDLKEWSFCTTFANLLHIFFLVLLFCLGFMGIYISKIYPIDQLNDEKTCLDTFGQLSDINKKTNDISTKLFCTKDCPCTMTKDLIDKLPDKKLVPVTDKAGKDKAQNCTNFAKFSSLNESVANSWGIIEQHFDCAGICKISPWYLFSDVNDGLPIMPCVKGIMNFYLEKGKFLGWIFIGISSLFFFDVFCLCCLCCHPKRFDPIGEKKEEAFVQIT